MINFDESALICDLAETYQIYDYRSLPARSVATLSAGLRENSRIKMKEEGRTASHETILLATIADRIGSMLKDNNGNPPELLAPLFYESATEKKGTFDSFDSSNDFEACRNAILRGE